MSGVSGLSRLARPEIRALKAYESARSLMAPGGDAIFLDANESPSGESGLNRYPEPQPRALLERFRSLYGVPSERTIVGRGSDEAIDLLVRAFCRAGEDSILISPPTYGVYEISAKIQGAFVKQVPLLGLDTGRPKLDVAGLEGALEAVKLVFICSPNNPTGTVFAPQDIARLCQVTTGRALVVVDEAYAEYSGEESALTKLGEHPNLVVLRTLSKAWALAGARCGAAFADPEVIALLKKVIAPYPLPRPAVDAVLKATRSEAADDMRQRVSEAVSERERVSARLREWSGVKRVFESRTNFLLAEFSDAAKVMQATRAAGVIVRDRSSEPGLAGCVRLTVGAPVENEALLAALAKAVS
jgi:histidinol-phosphate aminotransferase